MKQNQQVADAGTTENTPDGNIGYGEFEVLRLGKPVEEAPPEPEEEQPEEPEEPTEEPETEEPPAEQEGIADESDVTVDAETVLSQLENLSPEEIKAISKEIGSRAGERIGTLTARRKQAEAEAAHWKAELAKAKANPLDEPEPVENNPFSKLESIEDVVKQKKDLENIDEWADNLLWRHNNADPEDVITTEEGKDYTKAEVREYQLQARKGLKTFLPARVNEIQRGEYYKQVEAQNRELIRTQLDWYGDEENQTYKSYQNTMKQPIIKKIKELIPEIAPQVEVIFAHATNSMASFASKPKEKKVPAKKGELPKPKPPSNPSGFGSRSQERGGENMSKKLKDLTARVQETGQIADFERLRAEQIANRYKKT